MAPWIDVAGWTLLHFVWQGTAIGIIAAVGFRLLRGSAPHTRYALASAAMVTLLIAPLATAARLSSSAPVVADPRNVTSAISLTPTLASDPVSREKLTTPAIQKTAARPRVDAVLRATVLLWLAGLALLQLRLIGGWWRVRGLHRASLDAIPSAWQTRAALLATRLGLRPLVRVVE